MRRITALLLVFLLVFSLFSCGNDVDEKESEKEITDTESDTLESEKEEENMKASGIKLTDEFTFVARDDSDKVRDVKYERIGDLEGEYLREDDGYYFLSVNAPQIEVGGIAHSEGTLTRLDSQMVKISKYYENSAGVTLRFCTTANEIMLKGSFKDKYSSNTTVPRGSYGIDVYVGAGTDKDYCGARMQKLTSTMLSETLKLPAGRKEVLINMPLLADVSSFEIGFSAKSDRIAPPTERDMAPIVFYGGKLTQGLSASRPGNAYANIVGRMLDADTINLGSLGGAHGDETIAEYIADIDSISAFVMELDEGATAEELREKHYKFYKTVRTAHPEIPIIIMTTPTFSAEAAAEAAEKRAIIAETYEKALEEGDGRVYFLDANDTFPHGGDLADIYTGDMKTASDTGMYSIALGVYDVLNSAFTPDSEKSGVDRKPGAMDKLSFVPQNRADELENGEYVKISELDEKYITNKNGDFTYLSMSAPCFTFGGIAHPDDNGGLYHRLDVSKKDELLSQITAKSSDNVVSSGYDKLLKHLSAATLRFRTDASEISLKIAFANQTLNLAHFSNRGSAGIDIYVGSGTERYYVGESGESYTGSSIVKTVKLPGEYTEVQINLPLYGGIKSIQIGFSDSDASVAPALERVYKAPIVLYGASEVQGACASRPGLSYPGLLTRMLDVDFYSLACSGLGWADLPMAEYIADLDMTALVITPSSGDFPDRIYDFYKIIREKNPDLPIIYYGSLRAADEQEENRVKRDNVLKAQYERAKAEGDKNVYYFDIVGKISVEDNRDLLSVDFAHPNDLGFYYMAESIYHILVSVLGE